MNNCENYLVDLPYPSVNIQRDNSRYASLISGAFAGPGSETTAIAQYAAHNFYTVDYPEIHHAYQCIISVEVLHFELLGALIRDLGCRPKFLTYENCRYWSGSFPVYAYAMISILNADIEGEKAAIEHYTQLIQQIHHAEIQNLFRRIILDEQKHVEVLTNFLNSIKK